MDTVVTNALHFHSDGNFGDLVHCGATKDLALGLGTTDQEGPGLDYARHFRTYNTFLGIGSLQDTHSRVL